MYETIVANIEAFINGIGDGRYYDITSFNETKNSLKWVNPLDVLEGAALEEYKQYVENMHAYLKGKKERCEVYKYDPVNMCNGNYINEHTDIELGGRYTLEFKRYGAVILAGKTILDNIDYIISESELLNDSYYHCMFTRLWGSCPHNPRIL